jgi:predicted esterase
MSTKASILLILLLFVAPSARAEPVLHTASTHPLRCYVVEPSRQQPPGKRLPVLVCLEGAGADFRGAAIRFARARGDTPILIVVPCTFSSTNAMRGEVRQRYTDLYGESLVDTVGGVGLVPAIRSRLAWDEEGLLAALVDIGRQRAVEERFYLTGFSGGGILTWWMTLRHPARLAGVVPVCPNHAFLSVSSSDASPGSRATPILVISGENDPLRRSRIGLPMPPLGLTLILALVLGAGAGYVVWLRWRRARRARTVVLVLVLALLAATLVVGRISGNDFQTAMAVEMMEQLGHPVQWKHQPGMWHDPAPGLVLAVIGQWRQETSERPD